MPASHRHLDHLSPVLNECGIPPQRQPLAERDRQGLFQSIALDRVRIGRAGWQGHPVHAMRWHLSNLKPAAKAALSRYIVDQWYARAVVNTAPVIPNETAVPMPPVNRAVDKQSTGALCGKNSRENSQHSPASAAKPVPHRDGFDRMTDWVAALVSLWK